MNLGLALFHWMLNLDGIDMVLRATSGRSVVTFKTKVAEAPYKQRGDALKEAMAGDRPLALFVAKVGTDLADAEALIEWAKATLIRIQQLPDDAKRSALADEEWAKLNGSVSFLSSLAEKARAHAALAPHFAEPQPGPLPFEPTMWNDKAVTAPLKPGTGRLSGGR
jgi:hypothetical protein